MSCSAPSELAQTQANWITPAEQMHRLALSLAKAQVEKNRGNLQSLTVGYNPQLEELIIECATASILRRSILPNQRASLREIAVEQLLKLDPLSQSLTNWYTAHSRLQLRLKIPPLPNHIHHIMDSKCPIYDGVRIQDTHFLALVSEEFGTLNRFESEVLQPYGEKAYPNKQHPLRFRKFWPIARRQHADAPFPTTHWVLMTKDVLPESRNKIWADQVALVNALSAKAYVDYTVPTLQQSLVAITTYMVATEERCYQAGDNQNGNRYTYTRTKTHTAGYQVIVGGFSPLGVRVLSGCLGGAEALGVAALRVLGN